MTKLVVRSGSLSALMLTLSLLGCGDDDGDKTPMDGSTPTSDASSIDAARTDAGAADSGAAANKLGCPDQLECVAPQGVFVCQLPGPKAVPCERNSDCPSGIPMCFALGGQGVCLALCTPDDGFPATVTMSGKVVDYVAGTGQVGFSETNTAPAASGVKVCIESPAQLKAQVPCATTDASGAFTFTGLPPNRNPAQPVGGLISFTKDGYLPQLTGFSLGNGSQELGAKIRMLTVAAATELATAAGASLPSATTGWIMAGAARFDIEGTKGEYSYKSGAQDLLSMSNVTITSMPAAGSGAIYLDAMEKVPAGGADAGVASGTSIAGSAVFFDVAASAPATPYTLTLSHPTLNCGAPSVVNVVPGFVYTGVGAACGKGVTQ